MKGSMAEQAERHFNARLRSVWILSVVMVCAGAYWLWAGLEEWKRKGSMAISGSGALLLLGVCSVLSGIWGLCFSGKRNQNFPKHAILLWSSREIFGTGWFMEIVFLVCTGLYLMFRTKEGSDGNFLFLLYALLTAPFAFLSFFIYRNRYLMLCEGQMEYRGCFRRKTFSKTDVAKIRIMEKKGRYGSDFITGYCFLDADGKTLFTAGKDMVHVQDLMNCFPDLYRQAAMVHLAGKQKEEQKQREEKRIEELSEPKVPAKEVRKAKSVSWILFFADLIAGVVLTLLQNYTYLMSGWQYCLLMELLPMNYLVYIWIYADLAGEGRWEDDEWMKRHISVEMRWTILILQNLLLVLNSLLVSMQCVRNAGRIFWTGLAIFMVLSAVTVRRMGLKKNKRGPLLFTVMMTGILCWSLTLTLFLTAAGPVRSRMVEVTGLSQSRGRSVSYHAFILQEDGSEVRLEVSPGVYRRLDQGGQAFLCTYNSLFDTEFVYLWAGRSEKR